MRDTKAPSGQETIIDGHRTSARPSPPEEQFSVGVNALFSSTILGYSGARARATTRLNASTKCDKIEH